ncbi:hypothetical protein [Peptococcus niger]|uniref:Uncharacterized protein n=1 Tax=Peptococcus niger TaxID=2741 RepID=A0A1G6S526_PEPNI|nr:hypothetical protein [Peptococcus niger]SDD11791.1 hypothetical protein SAMN04489866_101224 [Peptococcus niger]
MTLTVKKSLSIFLIFIVIVSSAIVPKRSYAIAPAVAAGAVEVIQLALALSVVVTGLVLTKGDVYQLTEDFINSCDDAQLRTLEKIATKPNVVLTADLYLLLKKAAEIALANPTIKVYKNPHFSPSNIGAKGETIPLAYTDSTNLPKYVKSDIADIASNPKTLELFRMANSAYVVAFCAATEWGQMYTILNPGLSYYVVDEFGKYRTGVSSYQSIPVYKYKYGEWVLVGTEAISFTLSALLDTFDYLYTPDGQAVPTSVDAPTQVIEIPTQLDALLEGDIVGDVSLPAVDTLTLNPTAVSQSISADWATSLDLVDVSVSVGDVLTGVDVGDASIDIDLDTSILDKILEQTRVASNAVSQVLTGVQSIPATLSAALSAALTGVQAKLDVISLALDGFFDISQFSFDLAPIKAAGADLSKVFPFCLPFDLLKSIKVYLVPAQIPDLTIDIDTDFVTVYRKIDLTSIVYVLAFVKVVAVVFYMNWLITITKKLIKW